MENAHGVGDGADRATLARTIMRRQARIGLRVAVGFLVPLLGLPLLNLYAPDVMATRVGGFSLTWLLLGMLLYPLMWALSLAFVRGSDRIEEEIVRDYAGIADCGSRIAEVAPQNLAPTTQSPEPSAKRKLFVEEDEA